MKYCKQFMKTLLEFCEIKDKVVVDAGAWTGKFTERFARDASLVISVEPDIDNFREILKMDLKNIIPVCVALDRKTEMREFKVYEKTYRNTFYNKSKHHAFKLRNILSVSWDDLMEYLNIKHVDFMKVNIEGSEEGLIEGMTKVFPDKMIIEEHTKNKITNIDNLFRLLEEKGYKIIKRDPYDIYVVRN